MKSLTQFSVVFLLALAVGLVAFAALAYFEPSQVAARQQLALLQVQDSTHSALLNRAQATQEATIRAEHTTLLAPLQLLAGAFWLLFLPAAALAVAIIGIDAYRLRRAPLIRANDAGLLPVARRALEQEPGAALALLAAYHQQQLVRASTPARIAVRNGEQPAPVVEVLPVVDPGLPIAPAFATLWADGFRPTMERLLLGYGASGAIYGSVDDLLSVLLVGKPGTGKSTYLRLVVAQLAHIGAQIGILDPHGSISDDCPIAATWKAEEPGEFDRVAATLCRELDKRLAQRKSGKRDFVPGLILADEWNILSEMSPTCGATLKRVILEGRKVSLFAVIAGQAAPAKSFGDSTARDGMSSRVIFNVERRQAAMAGLPLEDAKRLLPLLARDPRGHAILHRSSCEAEIITVPNVKPADLSFCAPALPSAPQQAGNGTGKQRETVIDGTAQEVAREAVVEDERAQQVRAMLKEGSSPPAIVRALWNVQGGRAYQTALDELTGILAAMV